MTPRTVMTKVRQGQREIDAFTAADWAVVRKRNIPLAFRFSIRCAIEQCDLQNLNFLQPTVAHAAQSKRRPLPSSVGNLPIAACCSANWFGTLPKPFKFEKLIFVLANPQSQTDLFAWGDIKFAINNKGNSAFACPDGG
ncbi:hypothetical protein M513_03465 [Trichuris suis]|uniref:Uncharacterized protein n=1 Tax=Trichuris suis TaxID=68888 RepID=A0A085MES1_9BILA|nr:hypothetical protein M513_03465 [Trichuris suis]